MGSTNTSMDRLYCRFAIAAWLLDRKVTMVGTLESTLIGMRGQL